MDISEKYDRTIKSLDLSNQHLTSIEGLEQFTNLEKLNLSGNRLTTIDFLVDLKELTQLNLRDNNVIDLSPLTGLPYLQKLNIRGNQVKCLKALETKMHLENLNARNNQITSIKPLLCLPLHDRLYLRGNDILDVHLLKGKQKTIDKTDFNMIIPRPILEKPSGVYDKTLQLKMHTETNDTIYYTLDGSMPTTKSSKYKGAIELSEEVMLSLPINANYKTSPLSERFSFVPQDVKHAITVTAVANRKEQYSKPVVSTYILKRDLFTQSDLPVISLKVDPNDFFDDEEGIYVPGIRFKPGNNGTGNYYLKGRNAEKNGSIEFFNQDGTLNFKQNIGVRINGSFTRRLPQKSLRIYSRSDYGQSHIYTNIFKDLPYTEYKMLVLRNSGDDYKSTLMRDGLMHELVKDLDIDVQAYQPAILLLNGEYWGIHNIREKFTEDYLSIKYNVKKSDLVLMKIEQKNGIRFNLKAGSPEDKTDYQNLVKYVTDSDMTKDTDLDHVEGLMDVDNFLHYVAYQVYYGNTDSFSNNLMIWKKKAEDTPDEINNHDDRWRWMLYDLDWGMGYGLLNIEGDPITYNMIEHVLRDEERMELFRGIMKNEEIKNKFIQIMLTLLQTHFEPTHVKNKINELADKIRPEIPRSIARWRNIESIEEWERNIQVLHEFADRRPGIIKEHLMKEFAVTKEDIIRMSS